MMALALALARGGPSPGGPLSDGSGVGPVRVVVARAVTGVGQGSAHGKHPRSGNLLVPMVKATKLSVGAAMHLGRSGVDQDHLLSEVPLDAQTAIMATRTITVAAGVFAPAISAS